MRAEEEMLFLRHKPAFDIPVLESHPPFLVDQTAFSQQSTYINREF